MVNPKWGLKRLCLGCGAHFYDMCRRPATCPKCQTVFDLETLYKSKKSKGAAEVKENAHQVVNLFESDLDEDLGVEEEGSDDDLLEDPEDLDVGDEDVTGVVEKVELHDEEEI